MGTEDEIMEETTVETTDIVPVEEEDSDDGIGVGMVLAIGGLIVGGIAGVRSFLRRRKEKKYTKVDPEEVRLVKNK